MWSVVIVNDDEEQAHITMSNDMGLCRTVHIPEHTDVYGRLSDVVGDLLAISDQVDSPPLSQRHPQLNPDPDLAGGNW